MGIVEQRARARKIRQIGMDIRARLPASAGARSLLREVQKAEKLAGELPRDNDPLILNLGRLLMETVASLTDAQALLDETRKYLSEQIARYPIP